MAHLLRCFIHDLPFFKMVIFFGEKFPESNLLNIRPMWPTVVGQWDSTRGNIMLLRGKKKHSYATKNDPFGSMISVFFNEKTTTGYPTECKKLHPKTYPHTCICVRIMFVHICMYNKVHMNMYIISILLLCM